MPTTATLQRTYPRSLKVNGGTIELRRLSADGEQVMLEFARSLGESDLLFLRFDLTDPEVVRRIIADQASDRRVTVLAFADGKAVGYASLSRDSLSWTRHMGEIRVIVGESHRGQGLGARLAHEIFEVSQELKLSKVVARMALRQEGARRLFERLGFSAEALLSDWVMDRSGQTHDLIIMSHDVTSLTG